MSLAVQSETAAGALAAAAAAAALWRGSARYEAPLRLAYRWFSVVAIAWGAGLVAQQALTGPLGGAAVPLTFGDLLALLALPAMLAGFAGLAAAGRGAGPERAAGAGSAAGARDDAGTGETLADAGHAAAAGRTPAALLPRDAVARFADTYILAASLFVIGWITLFGSIYHRSGDGAGTFVLALLHPMADLAVLGVALQYAVRAGRRGIAPFLALLAVTVSDALSVGAKVNAASPGLWAQLTQLAAFVLLGVAPLAGSGLAWLPRSGPVRGVTRLARGHPRRAGGRVTQLAAAAAAAAAVVIIGWAAAGGSAAEPAVVAVAGLAVLALAARIAGLLVSDRAASVTEQEAGRQFRELADRITDAVLLCDLDGTVRYASPAVAEYGYSPAKLDGMTLAELIHPEDLPGGIRSVHAAARRTPATGRLPCRVRSSDGTWRHVEATVSRQRYPDSADLLLVTARDVSDQVALRRQVTHLTFHDGLTGLPNRAYLEERAKDALGAELQPAELAVPEPAAGGPAAGSAAASEPPVVTGAIFLDLDGFTGVNDSVGHGAGDLLLAQAARLAPRRGPAARYRGQVGGRRVRRAGGERGQRPGDRGHRGTAGRVDRRHGVPRRRP